MQTPANTEQSVPTARDVHQRIVELYTAGQLDRAIELVAPDAVDHLGGRGGDAHGRAAWRRKWDTLRDGATRTEMTVEQNVSADDLSVNRYAFRTTSADGDVFETTGMDMVRVRNGQIVEHWAFMHGGPDLGALKTD